MEYKIVHNPSPENLEIEINSLLKKGWVLQGGVSCSISESDEYEYWMFCQALSRPTTR